MAVLQAIDSVDSTDIQFTVGVNELVVSRETVCRSADSAPADHVPCPDFDGTPQTLAPVAVAVPAVTHVIQRPPVPLPRRSRRLAEKNIIRQ